jgi:hypothetical protein
MVFTIFGIFFLVSKPNHVLVQEWNATVPVLSKLVQDWPLQDLVSVDGKMVLFHGRLRI